MSVICGNEFQPSLRDLVYSHAAPNAEALGYYHPVPPGLSRVTSWIRHAMEYLHLSPQHGYCFVTHWPALLRAMADFGLASPFVSAKRKDRSSCYSITSFSNSCSNKAGSKPT